jgi:phosphotriesterase-related protein
MNYFSSSHPTVGPLMTVTGPIRPAKAGVTDAHNHVWIAPMAGTGPGLPQLFDKPNIMAELSDYREAGGGTLIDCQPGGCGRDGRVLLELSRASGVHLVACTGFHLRKYYPPDYWLWQASVSEAQAYFVREIREGLAETRKIDQPVRAGCIKVACEVSVTQSPAALLEAAAMASLETGLAIEVHTEKGAEAEKIVAWFTRYDLRPERLILCHLDKRPDLDLHRHLAQQGVMLVYDTFYRPKYQPDKNVWPLLERMVADGLERQIAIATDMAEASMWSRLGGGPGLVGLITKIIPRLQNIGFEQSTIERLVGQNIANRLAQPTNGFIQRVSAHPNFVTT